jgi:hypothetical protein
MPFVIKHAAKCFASRKGWYTLAGLGVTQRCDWPA